MTDDEFKAHKKKLEAEHYAPPTHLGELSERYWSEISNESYNFGRTKILLKVLQSLKKMHLITFFEVGRENSTFCILFKIVLRV